MSLTITANKLSFISGNTFHCRFISQIERGISNEFEHQNSWAWISDGSNWSGLSSLNSDRTWEDT